MPELFVADYDGPDQRSELGRLIGLVGSFRNCLPRGLLQERGNVSKGQSMPGMSISDRHEDTAMRRPGVAASGTLPFA